MKFQNIYYKEYLDLFQHGSSQSTHQEFDSSQQQLVTQPISLEDYVAIPHFSQNIYLKSKIIKRFSGYFL